MQREVRICSAENRKMNWSLWRRKWPSLQCCVDGHFLVETRTPVNHQSPPTHQSCRLEMLGRSTLNTNITTIVLYAWVGRRETVAIMRPGRGWNKDTFLFLNERLDFVAVPLGVGSRLYLVGSNIFNSFRFPPWAHQLKIKDSIQTRTYVVVKNWTQLNNQKLQK